MRQSRLPQNRFEGCENELFLLQEVYDAEYEGYARAHGTGGRVGRVGGVGAVAEGGLVHEVLRADGEGGAEGGFDDYGAARAGEGEDVAAEFGVVEL